VFIPTTTFTAMPNAGAEVSLDIHTHVREDALSLYGFSSRQERRVFERLISIPALGPKLAVTILSVVLLRVLSEPSVEETLRGSRQFPVSAKEPLNELLSS
jgi:Holliday junction resolvasome RuvABC DNA-binding subunit